MKVWFIGACAIVLAIFALAPARADNGCAAAVQTFRQADDDFSQADKTRDKADWERGNSIIEAHRADIAPMDCDQDEFDLVRLVAMEHGLRTGVTLGMVDAAEAVRAASDVQNTTIYNAQVRRSYMDVRADLKKRFGDLLSRADRYVAEIGDSYRSSITAMGQGAGKCARPFADATVTRVAAPEFPRQARGMRGTFTALIRVTILPNGDLKDATVMQSTGDRYLDGAAVEAARASQYTPKVVNCRPVTAEYLFRITFTAA